MAKKTGKPPALEIPTRGPSQLGHAIGRYRARSKLSQTALAKSAGVRQATLSKVEKGVGTTALQTLYSVCAALGLEVVLRPRDPRDREDKIEDLF